jgi:carbamoyltransferase
MKILGIFGGHDANLTFYDSERNECRIIEIERVVKKRYFRLHVDNSKEFITDILLHCKKISQDFWGFGSHFEKVSIVKDGAVDLDLLSKVFSWEYLEYVDHHHSHAAGAFYQSQFDESLIISYDGGGNDGYFNVYLGDSNGVHLLEKRNYNFGGAYMLLASCITEISKTSSHQLSLPGKMMGLCAYGSPDYGKIDFFRNFFRNMDYKKFSDDSGYNLKNPDNPWGDGSERGPLLNYKFEGEESYNFAATSQLAYEDEFISILEDVFSKYGKNNLCITGGGALNVLLNQRIKNSYDVGVFIPPNPNDCGLSLGACLISDGNNYRIKNIAYNGLPIMDKQNFTDLLKGRKVSELNMDYLCSILKHGKIVGVCSGDSEVGPRALGNRSIICDPSYKNMKEILNSKVKFREWFRPFAPFCLRDEAHLYFESENFENFEFMGYAPKVKEEFKNLIPSITHEDGTSRLQTVTEDSHRFFYELLSNFKKYSEANVLLNTSFNIRGNPILSTFEDALYVLDNTELDCLVLEGVLIEKI